MHTRLVVSLIMLSAAYFALQHTPLRDMAYTMVCLLEAKPERVDQVKEYLLTVAKSCECPSRRKNSCPVCQDPQTLTWTVQQDLCDPRQFCIVERYVSRKVRDRQGVGSL